MSNSALPEFLQRLCRLPLLTADQERELAGEMRQGSKLARDTLVERNIRLAVRWAVRYSTSSGAPLEPLIQAGLAGMAEGVERFNPDAGRFTTYITFWIKKGIYEWFRKEPLIKIPVNLRNYLARLSDEEIEEKVREDADSGAFGAFSGDSIRKALRLMKTSQLVSLDLITSGEDNKASGLACHKTEDPVHAEERRDDYRALYAHLDKLEERERIVLVLRYGLDQKETPRTLGTIGNHLGISKERVRQIQMGALAKLRTQLGAVLLPESAPDEQSPQ